MRYIAFLLVLLAIAEIFPACADPSSRDKFTHCATDEVMRSIREANGSIRGGDRSIDKKRVINDVEQICNQMPDGITTHAEIDAEMKREGTIVSRLFDRFQSTAIAQGKEMGETGRVYVACLREHAKIMALSTIEAADVVVRAAMSSCPDQRQAIADVHFKYRDSWSEGTAEAMDSVLAKRLLTDIIAARAQRNLLPPKTVPAPTPQGKPSSPI